MGTRWASLRRSVGAIAAAIVVAASLGLSGGCAAEEAQSTCQRFDDKLSTCGVVWYGDGGPCSSEESMCLSTCLLPLSCAQLQAGEYPVETHDCVNVCAPPSYCDNGDPLPSAYLCDGEADCSDGSDEVGCP